MKGFTILALVYCVTLVAGDLYMQNPRGSNDRLNEDNENRNNGNRLFDSQNNAKGGYCVGPAMNFYSGSLLSIEWTSQHGCGNPNTYCNLVIQYMCSNSDAAPTLRVRDGTTTNTIPDTAASPAQTDANGNLLFGMHETFDYYQDCKTRSRNLGLYIADREEEGGLNEGRRSSIFTRQNNNGNRHAYECPEERDYYPYWAPTPWKDVAILTDKTEFCNFYTSESQNVKDKNVCRTPEGETAQQNNEAECKSEGNNWEVVPAFGIAPPVCVQAPWNRQNHLGNGIDIQGYTSSFNWTLPDEKQEPCITASNCNCVLRMRYNISTGDYGASGNRPDKDFVDSAANAAASPVSQDPTVTVEGVGLQLAIDTSQFGRTFQDRSHIFHIRPRPAGTSPLARIWNLNVRGKRGNIVQAYPATEYDFIPENLIARVGDLVHFQWTGCDTNPAGNAGEGTPKTDRHNIVEIETLDVSEPASDEFLARNPMFESAELRVLFAYLGQTNCPTQEQLLADNNNNENQAKQDPRNCFKLNAAPAYFDSLVKVNKTGIHNYMSTRNNNFTNRGQKAVLDIQDLLPVWGIVVVAVGGFVFAGAASVAGAMFYAKSHPHSQVAQLVNKM